MTHTDLPDRDPAERPVSYQACRHYAESQLADIDAHVQAIVRRMVTRLPSLYDVSDEVGTEMRQWLRQLTVATMECLRDGTDLDVLAPSIEAVARRRKSLGIEQSATMSSSRYGQQALLDHAQEFFRGHPHEAEMLAQIVPRLMEFQHVMTLSVASGYASEPDTDQISDRQARIQLLLETLSGRRAGQGQSEVQEMAACLGLKLSLRLVTVSAELKGDAAEQVQSIARMNHWAVVGLIDQRAIALTARAQCLSGTPEARAHSRPMPLTSRLRPPSIERPRPPTLPAGCGSQN